MSEENGLTEDNELYVEQLLLGPMENFAYIIGSRKTREVVLIDPAWEIDTLLNHLEEKDLKLNSVLLTHYHPDHCGGSMGGHTIPGVAELMEKNPVKIYVNKHEAQGVKKVTGVENSDLVLVDSGDKLSLGDVDIEFLHTPGHTPGSQCFKVRDQLVSGDTLFIQGCGRVDLPGSNVDDMYHSMKRLAELPNDTVLLPGHRYSPESHDTMENIKANNFYLSVKTLEIWRNMMG